MALGPVVVEASAEDLFETGGSVHRLGEEELESLNYDDPMAVLVRVPGVYVRSEEGFGLRPNIGMRGASAERSRKITLMEDGVLIAPAPYSAPAAYYFPLITRMTGVDVYLGPSAILYGPNTIGGAIDLRGREIPTRREGHLELALGSTWWGRMHAYYGDSNSWGGFLIEGVHVRSSGFQAMDQCFRDCDTGFGRTDLQGRADLHGMAGPGVFHQLQLTVGLGLEESNTGYTGLTADDFRATPYRRYAATGLDRMEWWRTRVELRYTMEFGEDADLVITAYRHDFQRDFRRLEGFSGGDAPSLSSVLGNPTGANAVYYEILAGLSDSTGLTDRLSVARNRRLFAAQGLQAATRVRFDTDVLHHQIQAGARLHYDEIRRDHTHRLYDTRLGQLVAASDPLPGTQNFDSAWAISAYASWAITWQRLTLTPGARVELIWSGRNDFTSGLRQSTEQLAFLPGVGLTYELVDALALFAGVYQGFSPLAPGQAAGTQPELAVNYEVGARYGRAGDATTGQLSFFVSDYSNLVGTCTAASGCEDRAIDVQTNAGGVTVLGIEAAASHRLRIEEVTLPLRAAYTFTYSRFRSAFISDNPQFGSVAIGARLPYVPEHQLSFQVGFLWDRLDVQASGVFVSQMTDSTDANALLTDAYFTLDATARVEVFPGFKLTLRGENLTNTQPIMSYRPWGARGARPVLVQGGVEIDF